MGEFWKFFGDQEYGFLRIERRGGFNHCFSCPWIQLLFSYYHYFVMFPPGNSFASLKRSAVMPSANLQNVSGSSPPCYFCAPSPSHGEAPATPALRLCSPYSFLSSGTELGMRLVEAQCTWYQMWNPGTKMCLEGACWGDVLGWEVHATHLKYIRNFFEEFCAFRIHLCSVFFTALGIIFLNPFLELLNLWMTAHYLKIWILE